MSRRYGRNQRRQARDEQARLAREITRLEHHAAEHYQDRIREQRRRIDLEADMVEWADRIISLLGDETAFARKLAEVGVEAGLFARVVRGMPYRLPMRDDRLARNWLRPDGAALVSYSERVIEAFAVYARSDEQELDYRRMFSIRGPDGERALIVDLQTLEMLRDGGDGGLKRYLLEVLVEPWAKGKGR